MATSCTACGLPPLPNQRLLRCTRCHNAWYHNVACQKKNFKRHKAECLRIAANIRVSSSSPGSSGGNTSNNIDDDSKPPVSASAATAELREDRNESSSLVECRTIEGKGRSLFAAAALPKWSRPFQTSTQIDGLCSPLVPPTLYDSYRTTHCSYCFRRLRAARQGWVLHAHCNPLCQNLDVYWRNETMASKKLIDSGEAIQPPDPVSIFCSRIIRKCQSDEHAKKEFEQLSYCDEDMLSEAEKDSCQFVMRQCSSILYHMGDILASKTAFQMIEPDPSPAYRFVSRISMNAFPIFSSDSCPIGDGIYLRASIINHSCRPNAVQSFWFAKEGSDPPGLPKMQITACRSIEAGEEITIPYLEVTSPQEKRQKALWDVYKFRCECDWCLNSDVEMAMTGLQCRTPGCAGEVSLPQEGSAIDIGPQSTKRASALNKKKHRTKKEKRHKMMCNACGCTDFEAALNTRSRAMQQIENISSSVLDGTPSREEFENFGEEFYHSYEVFKKLCHIKTSWHVACAADSFLDWCTNAIPYCKDDRERMEIYRKALTVIEESRDAMEFCMNYPGNLRWPAYHLVLEAKIRLFVDPMDAKGLMVLKKTREMMLKFYPPWDELVKAIENTIDSHSVRRQEGLGRERYVYSSIP